MSGLAMPFMTGYIEHIQSFEILPGKLSSPLISSKIGHAIPSAAVGGNYLEVP